MIAFVKGINGDINNRGSSSTEIKSMINVARRGLGEYYDANQHIITNIH